MRRVWLAQLLCPQRHAILAATDEADDAAAAQAIADELRRNVDAMIGSGAINPWCGICHAAKATWTVELVRTQWATMAQAMPALRAQERENIATGRAIGEIDG